MVVEQNIVCPECEGQRLSKYGKKWVRVNGKREKKQQYICNSCGRVTINPKEVIK